MFDAIFIGPIAWKCKAACAAATAADRNFGAGQDVAAQCADITSAMKTYVLPVRICLTSSFPTFGQRFQPAAWGAEPSEDAM